MQNRSIADGEAILRRVGNGIGRLRTLVLILALACVLDTIVALRMSQTSDEDQHIAYGAKILRMQPDRDWTFFDSKTPISALNAIPQAIQNHAPIFHRVERISGSWKLARIPSILGALFLDFLVYLWAYELFGLVAAWASLLMAVLSPNLIAHGTLATTDGYFALGVLISLYYLRKYIIDPTLKNSCLSALTLAAAQLTKPLAIYLYGICAISLVASARMCASNWNIKRALTYSIVATGFFLAVLNIGYCFDRPFTKLSSYQFESSPLLRLQKIPMVRGIRIPVPYPFLQGLDMMMFSEENGLTYGRVYLLGELRSTDDPQFHGFKSYYAVAWFFKEPIALQILFFVGLAWIWKNRTSSQFLLGEGLLLVAAGALVLWLSLFDKAQVGIRHILPALAIEVVIAGAAYQRWTLSSRTNKAVLTILMLWMAVSMFSYYPHLIPYMNEWVVDRKLSYKILADSNLDWGQNAYLVRRFLRNNPDVVVNPETAVKGRILINANRLVGIWPKDKEPLLWARQYEPSAQIGYADLLYVIPSNAAYRTNAEVNNSK
jgi:4-amino-4-deoxy-L-arabinose transferase-like glycosyltransferase